MHYSPKPRLTKKIPSIIYLPSLLDEPHLFEPFDRHALLHKAHLAPLNNPLTNFNAQTKVQKSRDSAKIYLIIDGNSNSNSNSTSNSNNSRTYNSPNNCRRHLYKKIVQSAVRFILVTVFFISKNYTNNLQRLISLLNFPCLLFRICICSI